MPKLTTRRLRYACMRSQKKEVNGMFSTDKLFDLNFGLGALPIITDAKSRSISPENMEGRPGSGGKAKGGRKGSAFINIASKKKAIIAEIDGTGVIHHIWLTFPSKIGDELFLSRKLLIRMYWDREDEPSVEAPIGDFFGMGHGVRKTYYSLPMSICPQGGHNCYFPMPFETGARIEIENLSPIEITGFYYQIDYSLTNKLPKNLGRFHAQWRCESPTVKLRDYVIVDGIQGRGHYVGTVLSITTLEDNWWGEGEIKFYIDDDKEYPTICGTGTEDYFGGAWGFGEEFYSPFLGLPYSVGGEKTGGQHSMYRWHILDPIRFQKRLRVTIQQIGWKSGGLYERSDNVSSVAYWYQIEPHNKFPKISVNIC